MNKQEAIDLMERMIENPSLRRHCLTVALVMEAYAKKLGQDSDYWFVTGLLHDADYEQFPSEHPDVIVQLIKEKGLTEMAHAISAHHTRWGISYDTLLDKALIACDEMTGFIVACSLIRPTKLEGLKPKSVKKRFKNPKFAAGVERSEVLAGMKLFEVEMDEHIQFIVDTLYEHRVEIGLV